ncbi:hypothetical protein J715_0849 [Acinetobacter baumannii 1571545]|nr:hypothetical protein J715_0849 [Acinetobacter baumannii 1571545]
MLFKFPDPPLIPDNMYEQGVKIRNTDLEDKAENYIADHWYFIET